ncbi:MAG: sugar kinase [Nitrososphaeria archaeon]
MSKRGELFKMDVVTIGETMIQLNANQTGPLRYVSSFEKHVAGSESNFAIGIVRMQLKAGWISRVGDDEFGIEILNFIRGEGVDTSKVSVDPLSPTGIYFIQRGYPLPRKSAVFYYRKGSAASKLSPEDVNPDYLKSAKLLHMTGITPALSSSCRETTLHAIRIAKNLDMIVSFDTNLRLKLWTNINEAKDVYRKILEHVDILITSPSDMKYVLEVNDIDQAQSVCRKGPQMVVVKLGDKGAFCVTKEGKKYSVEPLRVEVVDPIGAGDSFAAGFISTYLKDGDLENALKIGNICGALATTVRGDVEGIPTYDLVRKILDGREEFYR